MRDEILKPIQKYEIKNSIPLLCWFQLRKISSILYLNTSPFLLLLFVSRLMFPLPLAEISISVTLYNAQNVLQTNIL